MSIYLSRLTLNSHHRRTRSEVERPYEMHRTLSKAWDELGAARVLFRSDRASPNAVSVIVQSLTPPDWSRLTASPDFLHAVDGPKRVSLSGVHDGQALKFRLRCCPSKRIGAKGDKDYGKRRLLHEQQDVFAWLSRKGKTLGFSPREAAFDRVPWFHSKDGFQQRPLMATVFDGVLVVKDADRFRDAVRDGIGPGKAFGFGLLSLAPI